MRHCITALALASRMSMHSVFAHACTISHAVQALASTANVHIIVHTTFHATPARKRARMHPPTHTHTPAFVGVALSLRSPQPQATKNLEKAKRVWDGDEAELAQVHNALGFCYFQMAKVSNRGCRRRAPLAILVATGVSDLLFVEGCGTEGK